MSSERLVKIQALVARLEEPNVLWDDVEEDLAGYPGWLQMVRTWRYPRSTPNMRTVQFGNPAQYLFMTQRQRLHLREFLRPYALMLDETRTPTDRAMVLQSAGVDTPAFCKEHLRDPIPEIAAAARVILDAAMSEKTLLRSAEPATDPQELLHVPCQIGTHPRELLRTDEAPATGSRRPGPNWLQRLFSRRKVR